MIKLPGYHVLHAVLENNSWTLYKAFDLTNQEAVSIKHRPHKLTNFDYAAAVHDFHLSQTLDNQAILQARVIERKGGTVYTVTEAFTGTSLQAVMEKGPLPVKEFLTLAARIAAAVASLHHVHITHKMLHPAHLLLTEKEAIKVTGFEQATFLSTEIQQLNESPYQLRNKVAYMSPEQTGKMNRPLDYRTDLYTLGVIFYEMITGKLPFETSSPAEMVYAHLAKVPTAPKELDPTIPAPISDLIMLLLAKSPSDRYQNTSILQTDLENCLQAWNQHGEIPDSTNLRQDDHAYSYERPLKLYGREAAIGQLTEGIAQVNRGKRGMIFITGPSGAGKTALVQELQKTLVRERGYMTTGKFVKLQKEVPYAPIIQAFQGLIRQILSEGQERTQEWKEKLENGIGSYGGVIANFIPEVEWLIGPQESPADLTPEGMHNRFRQAIRQFVGVFARADHPLILFIDDLQWADQATLDLLQHVLLHTNHLLLIGAFRDNEVYAGHPLYAVMKMLNENNLLITKIPVQPLEGPHVNKWINDVLNGENAAKTSIVELVLRITKGNPFYIEQLLKSLHRDRIITYKKEQGGWGVDVERLKQLPEMDSMISLTSQDVQRLPQDTIDMLQLASCLGNRFDLKLLATISGKTFMGVTDALWPGLEEGFIVPADPSYKWIYPEETALFHDQPPVYHFIHDKMQQAFYDSMDVKERERNHLKIGLELLHTFSEEERDINIFSIVNHLNPSKALLPAHKFSELAEWNWLAGEKALRRAAPEAAFHYYLSALKLLPANKWRLDAHPLTYRNMLGLGEAAYLTKQFEQAEEIFDEILANVEAVKDKLRVYNLKITLYTHVHQVEKATAAGLEGLRLVGWSFKENPTKLDIAKEYMLTRVALLKNRKKDLLNLPKVEDGDALYKLRTLINTNAPTYHVNQNLATVLMLRALRLSLSFGDMNITALVFNNYALTMSAGFKDYDTSFKFGKLAISHVEKFQENSLKARVYFVFGTFINHWKQHIRYNLDYLQRSQQLCLESGNLHLAGASGMFICLIHFMRGDRLSDVKQVIEGQVHFAKQNEYPISTTFLGELQEWMNVLLKEEGDVHYHHHVTGDDPSATIIHHIVRLQMSYILDDQLEAHQILNKLETLVGKTLILINVPDYFYYRALWFVRFAKENSLSRKSAKAKVTPLLKQLKQWANHSPTNFQHKYTHILAEYQFLLQGPSPQVDILYAEAAEGAMEHGYMQDAAVIYRCTAHYYRERKLHKLATSFMREAYSKFKEWEAFRVAAHLAKTYPDILLSEEESAQLMEVQPLDVNMMMEATSILSREVVLAELLKKWLQIVMTHAGAERAYFFLQGEESLSLAASNEVESDPITYEPPVPLKTGMEVPTTILNYVQRAGERVVLHDASKDGGYFGGDDFMAKQQVKSVLCLPILQQHRLIGILYLDNRHTAYVFTEEVTRLLTTLASQAAISIENAYLYAKLETKVTERTAQLHTVNKQLLLANETLAKAEVLRGKMLANISHDLRSPLATINGYVNAILDGIANTPEMQRDYLQVAKRRLHLLNHLVEDLFDLAQLESGNASFKMEMWPADELFKQLCPQYELEVNRSGLSFRQEMASGEQEWPLVEVDVRRMEQVLTNLVSNAIKHANDGGINISLSRAHNEVMMTVRDKGTGIAPEDLPYVFDRTYSKSATIGKKGHGLGLAISKEIINHHNGRIWAESEIEKGSSFHIALKGY
ncbi:AAA family ATPase [Oceanobacillus kapialis]|uniref:sensor histidine kinase n=1 Tax=Oceanobacillus kapialis TaxID=481353 RepID=UPI003850226C